MSATPPPNLAKTLLLHSENPSFAWSLFRSLFDKPNSISPPASPPPSAVSAIARILCDSKDALEHLLHLQKILLRLRHEPASKTLSALLRSLLRRPEFLPELYSDMLTSGHRPDNPTINLMIAELVNSGRLDHARQVFDKMHKKGFSLNPSSLGLLNRAYCRSGQTDAAAAIVSLGPPNQEVYNTLISGFCKQNRIDDADNVLRIMNENGFHPNVVTFNSRISALCRAGKLLEACRIFIDMQVEDGLPRPNMVTFKILLGGFCEIGDLERVAKFVCIMKKLGLFVELDSYNIWLRCLLKRGKLFESQMVLQEIEETGITPSIYTYNILIDGFCKEGMFSDARVLMDTMKANGVSPDIVSYSTLINGYCTKRKVIEAGRVLEEMQTNGCFPTTFTCNILLKSLWREGRETEASALLKKMKEKGCGLDTVTCNIMIDGLCKTGELDKAVEIVDDMCDHGSSALCSIDNDFDWLPEDNRKKDRCYPDVVTYSILIDGLCKLGRFVEAKKKLLDMIDRNIVPDTGVYDIFINDYVRHGKVSAALKVMNDMEKKGCSPSIKSYNWLIQGLSLHGNVEEVRRLIEKMKKTRVLPDAFSYNGLIKCLCERGSMKEGMSVLDEMMERDTVPNVASYGFLIKAFCKDDNFVGAEEVFRAACQFCSQKEGIYQVMFEELLKAGRLVEALEILKTAVQYNYRVERFGYKGLIERLCSENKVEDAYSILEEMRAKGYGLDPAAYMPILDALHKYGKKWEVDKLADAMMAVAGMGGDSCSKRRSFISHSKSKAQVFTSREKRAVLDGSHWRDLLHRDDGSPIALNVLKHVQKGWGHGGIPRLKKKRDISLDDLKEVP